MSCNITNLFVTDLQMVNISLRVLARPDQTFLPMIYRQIGTDYDERVLPSICNEVFSSVFSSPELQARAFLINILLLSVIIIYCGPGHIPVTFFSHLAKFNRTFFVVVIFVINFSHFCWLLQNYRANFN